MADAARRSRLQALLDAATTLQRPDSAAGMALRARLVETTRLSAENVELALEHCLETRPSRADTDRFLEVTPEAERAHVLLSSNVFVAALRAIALGVVSAPQVYVRASRRDPALAEALRAQAPGVFELVTELRPEPGDRIWAYGADETLARVRATLPPGVWFHAHGSGLGAVVLDANHADEQRLRALALDTALFDQRGCLSPRLVCVLGAAGRVRAVAAALARTLGEVERELPRGAETPAELGEARRQQDAAAYAYELFEAGSGWVSFSSDAVVPPSGRHLHVMPTADPIAALTPYRRHLTCIGASADAELEQRLRQTFAGSRVTALGQMQRPPLDGPVDLRHGTAGELVT